jgi:hypothetical protein
MTFTRLRLATAVFVTLTLLGAPAAQAFPGGGSRAVRSLEAPGFFSTLQGLLARLFPAGAKNRASIDPNGATAPDENRAGIDPDGAAVPENENRVTIDPNG